VKMIFKVASVHLGSKETPFPCGRGGIAVFSFRKRKLKEYTNRFWSTVGSGFWPW